MLFFYWPGGRGLSGVQGGAGAAGSARGVGAAGRGCSRPKSLRTSGLRSNFQSLLYNA